LDVLYSEIHGTIGHSGYRSLQGEFAVGSTMQYIISFANATIYPPAKAGAGIWPVS
jgi:hypothetical protein